MSNYLSNYYNSSGVCMQCPIFSIITPMWNGAEFIKETIDSVIKQNFYDWEMIIVDDCSPDGGLGAGIVKSYAKKDSRIKLIQLAKNKGSSGARNEALKTASGRYYAFLDSDDIWHPDYLITMKKHIDECTDDRVAIFFGGYRRMDSKCKNSVLPDYSCAGIKNFQTLLRHCPIFPSAAIVDSSRLSEKVFFREELRNLRDDYVYWLDIMRQGVVAKGYDDFLVDYRIREDSLTASKKKMIKPQWNVYRKVLHFNFLQSLFYLCSWGVNGVAKYWLSQLKKHDQS